MKYIIVRVGDAYYTKPDNEIKKDLEFRLHCYMSTDCRKGIVAVVKTLRKMVIDDSRNHKGLNMPLKTAVELCRKWGY